jgi:hypothetical protein
VLAGNRKVAGLFFFPNPTRGPLCAATPRAERVVQIATVAAFDHDLADSAVAATFAAAAHLPENQWRLKRL